MRLGHHTTQAPGMYAVTRLRLQSAGVNTYRVAVVASFDQSADILATMAELDRRRNGEPPDTTAIDITVTESVRIPPLRQTVKALYEVEGRDEDEACAFALAIYRRESPALGLPDPETLVANIDA